MKKLVPLIAGVLFAGTIAAQSIPNGGFESWNTKTWQDPLYYMSSNDQNFSKGLDSANATRDTVNYHGNYGVRLQTINTPQGAQPGYIIDGNPNGASISGGIAYSQTPTGIRFYYQYAPSGTDTAAVLVIFKNSGFPIDSFLITLPTAESSYTLHSYFPASPLPTAPDTVVFGAVSSLAGLRNGGGGNAGSTLLIDSVTFTGVASQPVNLNGDFENWTSDSILTLPGWFLSYPNVTRTIDADSGTYALELTTANTPQNGVQQGQASTGYYPQNCDSNCKEVGGFAYTGQIDTLRFSYKYAPAPGDTASVNLNFIKNGQSINGANISLYDTTAAYKDTILPFNLGQAPDTVIINITSSQHNNDTTNSQYTPYIGSTLKIDNIILASQKNALGINKIMATQGIKVYPNPANNQVNVDLTNASGSLQKLAIYDMSGRMLTSQSYSGGVRNTIETIDISSLSSGIYLIEATTNNGKLYQKIVKE